MTYSKLTRVCDELNMEFLPIFNSVEFKGDKILLYREKFAEEIKRKRNTLTSYGYSLDSRNMSSEEIDDIIEQLRNYFKEKMIIFYRSSKMRG